MLRDLDHNHEHFASLYQNTRIHFVPPPRDFAKPFIIIVTYLVLPGLVHPFFSSFCGVTRSLFSLQVLAADLPSPFCLRSCVCTELFKLSAELALESFWCPAEC